MTETDDKLKALVEEAVKESWHEGFQTAIFGHSDYGHTLKVRQALLNHKAIKDQVVEEIHALLEGRGKP